MATAHSHQRHPQIPPKGPDVLFEGHENHWQVARVQRCVLQISAHARPDISPPMSKPTLTYTRGSLMNKRLSFGDQHRGSRQPLQLPTKKRESACAPRRRATTVYSRGHCNWQAPFPVSQPGLKAPSTLPTLCNFLFFCFIRVVTIARTA